MNYLEIPSISKSFYDGQTLNKVLDKITFSIEKGSFVSIFGPNGCGKTTLFKIISNLERSDENQVLLEEKPIIKPNFSYLFQDSAVTLFPRMTCIDNIAFPLKLKGLNKSQRHEQVKQFLEELDVTLPLKQYTYNLSGGQKQLTAIIRALIVKPDLLLLDEPFSALDFETRLLMENKLLEIWSKTKVTTLLISHDLDEAVYMADKVIVLTKQPTKVAAEIHVNLPRPRDMSVLKTIEFYDLRNKVIEIFSRGKQ